VATQTDSRVDERPEDDEKAQRRAILGNGARACWRPCLGRGLRDQREKRQEGMLAATSRQGCAGGMSP
jgi:hypothetical protein